MNTKEQSRVFVLIPAAGRSQRMGQPKQLLEIRGRPMLLRVLDAACAAETQHVTIVTDASVCDVVRRSIQPESRNRVSMIENPDIAGDMISSVRVAIRHCRQHGGMRPDDGYLVCPGDLPGVSAADFNACIDVFRDSPRQIIVATHAGRRGHPLIFPAVYADFVLSSACDAGLHALPRLHQPYVREVERPTMGVTRDIDTFNDLDAIR